MRWTYSTPQISRRKYCKSARFEKPANWDTLFRRTSTTRFTPATRIAEKNFSADFFVKPMVKILTRPHREPL